MKPADRIAAANLADGLPRHVAIIMDGNGRWARKRALPRQAGHRAGVKAARAIIEECVRRHIETVTLFAFSSENWGRPSAEVSGLMNLFIEALEKEVEELHANGVRLRFIGDRGELNPALAEAAAAAERLTAANRNLELVVAIAYGGQWDIARAARELASAVSAGRLDPAQITPEVIGNALQTAGLPPVDLLIRTGGEQRISNFLLWDLAYSELFFSEAYWPDFDIDEFGTALAFFASRQRRFGRTDEQMADPC